MPRGSRWPIHAKRSLRAASVPATGMKPIVDCIAAPATPRSWSKSPQTAPRYRSSIIERAGCDGDAALAVIGTPEWCCAGLIGALGDLDIALSSLSQRASHPGRAGREVRSLWLDSSHPFIHQGAKRTQLALNMAACVIAREQSHFLAPLPDPVPIPLRLSNGALRPLQAHRMRIC